MADAPFTLKVFGLISEYQYFLAENLLTRLSPAAMAVSPRTATRVVPTRTSPRWGIRLAPCIPTLDSDAVLQLLETQGATSTLDFMQQFWLSDDESPEDFWEHEWETHGTCYSTLERACLPADSPIGAEAVAFFERVVSLFQARSSVGMRPTFSLT